LTCINIEAQGFSVNRTLSLIVCTTKKLFVLRYSSAAAQTKPFRVKLFLKVKKETLVFQARVAILVWTVHLVCKVCLVSFCFVKLKTYVFNFQ
jgi:hypothetical protein